MTSQMPAYSALFNASQTVAHESWSAGSNDVHGNPIDTYSDPVDRPVLAIYPTHEHPHRDPVSSAFQGRARADFMMEVPDATVYKRNDRVTWSGWVFQVQGYPVNYGDNNPFGFDKTMFGGSVHLMRIG